MRTDSLTTKAVARLLRVSEATVKRWADDGQLGSERTVGGHRRFSLQAIARLRREQGIEPGVAIALQKSTRKKRVAGLVPMSASFAQLLLRGDEKEAAAVLVDAYLHGHNLASLLDTTVTEAMHQVGELWSEGTITIADEHLATRVILGALQKLSEILHSAESTGLTAICCGLEGDLHELPVHMATMILETEGWETKDLGPNTPLFALHDMVASQRPHLVCISARSIADLHRATTEYAQLRKLTSKLGATIVIGGVGFVDSTLRARFPAECYPENFADLTKFVREMTRKSVIERRRI